MCLVVLVCSAAEPGTIETARGHLLAGRYPEAIDAYRAILRDKPATPAAHEGLVRALFAIPGTPESFTLAAIAARRRSQFEQAETQLRQALKLNPKHPLALYEMARLCDLLSRFATAQKLVYAAHKSAPDEPLFLNHYANTLLAHDVHVAALEQALKLYPPDAPAAAALKAHLEADRQTGDRWNPQLVSEYKPYTAKLVRTGLNAPYVYALKVRLNGRELTLRLDTGVSGVLINSGAARKAGIERLAHIAGSLNAIGNDNAKTVRQFLADNLSVGDLRFANVPVKVVDQVNDVDGIMGSVLFDQFLLVFDFPQGELHLKPYPGLQSAPDRSVLYDAQIPPPGFYPILRSAHQVLVPASINSKAPRLFLINSGSASTVVDVNAARQDAVVFRDGRTEVRGLNGRVDEVYRAINVRLAFAGVVQENASLTAIAMPGGEATASIGTSALSQVLMTLNYRDGCIKFERGTR